MYACICLNVYIYICVYVWFVRPLVSVMNSIIMVARYIYVSEKAE